MLGGVARCDFCQNVYRTGYQIQKFQFDKKKLL